MAERTFGFRTRALHAGGTPDAEHGARAVPIYQTHVVRVRGHRRRGQPLRPAEVRQHLLPHRQPHGGGLRGAHRLARGRPRRGGDVVGHGAEFLTFAALAGAGDHIVASSTLYGGTITQLDVTLRRFGVETTFVDSTDPADYAAAIRENTKAVYAEIVANPSGDIADLAGLAEVAHDAGVPLVVDATLRTPYLCRPIEHGADIVIHSATKFIGGHGTTLGGVVVEAGRSTGATAVPRDDRAGGLLRRCLVVGQLRRVRLPDQAALRAAARYRPLAVRTVAFLLLQGVETLPQRMDEHVANAQRVAESGWRPTTGSPG